MASVLDIATILICTALMTAVVSVALTFMWIVETREKAVGWWCSVMWCATIAAVLLSQRGEAAAWLTIGLGNAMMCVVYGLAWAGFVAFGGRCASWPVIALGPLVWISANLASEAIRDDVNNRIIVMSLIISVYCAMVVVEAWNIWKRERLPSLMAAVFLYVTHLVFYVVRVPLALYYPVDPLTMNQSSDWYALVTLEAFAHGMFIAFFFVSLIRERTERRYRLAAEIDSLTSVANRRYFVSETRKILDRKPRAAVMAVLDLDFFKKINDTYGHMAGDRVLQGFAGHVSGLLKPGMVFGRLGGEEFGLFMPDCSSDEAGAFLEELRAGVEALEIRFNGHGLKITTSIGAAAVDEAGLDFDHLMAGADNALYVSKRQGRNRSSLFSTAMRLEKIIEGGRESRISLSKKRVSRVAVRRSGRA